MSQFEHESEDQSDALNELIRDMKREQTSNGWYCGNCHNYHAPNVDTCPESARGGSLRERIERGGGIHNG